MGKMFPRWTAQEDIIVQRFSIREATALLPERTYEAVKSRRVALGVGLATKRWIKREDQLLRDNKTETVAHLAKKLKRRTPGAIQTRRCILGLGPVAGNSWWRTTELTLLRRIFPSVTKEELIERFPGRTWSSIHHRAMAEGLSRATSLFRRGPALHQEIRQRCRDDRIAIKKFGAEIGTGEYFVKPQTRIDYNKIGRAVEFFGGRLVIDWQDE